MYPGKVVIPAAGIGSRLLPYTKEMPKEMMPVFCAMQRSRALCLKPVLHVIFETLVDSGHRDFCIVVGRGKRAVEDYFAIDLGFLSALKTEKKKSVASELSSFYRRIDKASIAFVNQRESRGFGAAVLCAESFVGTDPFLMHAGDDLITAGTSHIRRLREVFVKTRADAAFFVEKTKHPEKYGVISGVRVEKGIYKVTQLVEKPRGVSLSNLGVVAIYALSPIVFEYLRRVRPDKHGEIQFADAIERMIRDRRRVYALRLRSGEKRIDIGTPESYRHALSLTL